MSPMGLLDLDLDVVRVRVAGGVVHREIGPVLAGFLEGVLGVRLLGVCGAVAERPLVLERRLPALGVGLELHLERRLPVLGLGVRPGEERRGLLAPVVVGPPAAGAGGGAAGAVVAVGPFGASLGPPPHPGAPSTTRVTSRAEQASVPFMKLPPGPK